MWIQNVALRAAYVWWEKPTVTHHDMKCLVHSYLQTNLTSSLIFPWCLQVTPCKLWECITAHSPLHPSEHKQVAGEPRGTPGQLCPCPLHRVRWRNMQHTGGVPRLWAAAEKWIERITQCTGSRPVYPLKGQILSKIWDLEECKSTQGASK